MTNSDIAAMPVAGRISDSVTLEWVSDGRIPVFTIADVTRPTIDTWLRSLADILRLWPTDRELAILHDISIPGAFLTPYARERVRELDTVNPTLKGHVALILPKTFVAQMVKIFLRTTQRNKVMTQIFYDRATGLAWLEQGLKK